ncbi:MAG: UDP-N-acetylglucosamine 1-carboxyvinyltransferase, partial [Oscillospiraceae bacterium]
MEKIIINGGKKLYGNVTIPVAKNSVLPILAASVLCDGIVTVRSVPTLSDTNAAVDILKSLGLHVR